ncbi:MAG: hypothetical protein HQK53_20045 [Oligoflexia bacterium]|nr:hypothetical protein [Oligoflexia bacterium]
MTIYIEDDKIKEANERCSKAFTELVIIANRYREDKNFSEFSRIMGKIEGLKLAQDYFNQCLKDL